MPDSTASLTSVSISFRSGIAALPFLLLMLIWLVMITYIPAISLWWKY